MLALVTNWITDELSFGFTEGEAPLQSPPPQAAYGHLPERRRAAYTFQDFRVEEKFDVDAQHFVLQLRAEAAGDGHAGSSGSVAVLWEASGGGVWEREVR